uniref:Sm domain-containing protein n=1 Tax=Phlebotomus papatasi TaxID=29031 RepID=A0A1B0EYD3_PHLPP
MADKNKNPSSSGGGDGKEKDKRRKESILDLSKYLEKTIRVKFAGGREAAGILKGYDPLLNLVLDNTTEFLRDQDEPFKLAEDTRNLGLVVCRDSSSRKMKKFVIKNLEKKPLNEVKLVWEGNPISAISEQFAEKRYRAKYTALPMEGLEVTCNLSSINEWLRNTQLFENEIDSFLRLNFHR